ncbi:MAG: sensor-containing diguanylate cyclase/phosphodiesterase [Nitrospirae bacterium]|nr:sensor-containing diguanylate cyclase/phosphodiesterase [Nitrospirota bacterium]
MDVKELRQKIAELEKQQSTYSDMGKQMKQTMSLLNATLESTADGLLVVDNFGKVVRYNRKFLKLWRIPESLAKQHDDKLLLDFVLNQLQDSESFLRKVHFLYSHNEEDSIDLLEFKDGRVFERYSQPQRIEHKIVGRVWSFRDITAHTQAKKALEKSNAESEAIFNSIADAAIVVDTQRRIVRINPAFTRIFGYEPEELKGHTTEILYINEADYVAIGQKYYHAGAVQGNPIFEMSYRRKDGTVFPAETMGALVIDSQGDILGYLGIHRDITERKQAGEMLRESEERFRRIFEDGPLGMIISAPNYWILNVNKATCEMLGYAEQELIGLSIADITLPEDLEKSVKLSRQALTGEIPFFHLEKRYFRKNGEIIWINLTVTAIHDQNGKVLYAIGMMEDISERKLSEQQKEKLISELQDALAEIRTLRGILPICASCKKIRDDKGYWNQIEVYIRDHSEAKFSHGICPDCEKKMYTDIDAED